MNVNTTFQIHTVLQHLDIIHTVLQHLDIINPELRHPRCVRYAKAKREGVLRRGTQKGYSEGVLRRGTQNTTNVIVELLVLRRHVSALLLGHHQVSKIQIGGEI
jgi:hypothetical protein